MSPNRILRGKFGLTTAVWAYGEGLIERVVEPVEILDFNLFIGFLPYLFASTDPI